MHTKKLMAEAPRVTRAVDQISMSIRAADREMETY